MGSPEDKPERFNDEGPQHEVVIGRPFALARFPVTELQFAQFWDAAGALRRLGEWAAAGKPDHPAVMITYAMAEAYCVWLSRETGRAYRLPSEAEWEYACRAGTMSAYAFGATIDRIQANFNGNEDGTTTVGRYPANGWALHDMHGNVWEWCVDHWHPSYEGAPTDGTAWLEAGGGGGRVLRGGSCVGGARSCRSACRRWSVPGSRGVNYGFRPVQVQS
jgi:formylglycine-generating enzyme required for sulfatase activity